MKTRWTSPSKLAALVAGALVLLIASSSAALANGVTDGDGQPNAGGATAALYKLQSSFHQAASTKDINLLMSLFAADATFVGPGNITYVGPAAIGRGFLTTGAYQPGNDWAGLTPSYRTRITILSGNRATMYFECDYVDRGTLQLKAQLVANTTEVRRDGKWLFETFTGGPPPPPL